MFFFSKYYFKRCLKIEFSVKFLIVPKGKEDVVVTLRGYQNSCFQFQTYPKCRTFNYYSGWQQHSFNCNTLMFDFVQ